MAKSIKLDRERALYIYETMNNIRSFEEKAVSLFEANQLRGSVHLCIGEEAIPATVCLCWTIMIILPLHTEGMDTALQKAPILTVQWRN